MTSEVWYQGLVRKELSMNRRHLECTALAVLAGLTFSTSAMGQPCTPEWIPEVIPGFKYVLGAITAQEQVHELRL